MAESGPEQIAVVCFEMGEINPMLDNENTMATNAFNILQKATAAIERRLRQEAVVSRG